MKNLTKSALEMFLENENITFVPITKFLNTLNTTYHVIKETVVNMVETNPKSSINVGLGSSATFLLIFVIILYKKMLISKEELTAY